MLLSIITATYNRGYCLGKIYESILKNNLISDVEWIIVDDGSVDNTTSLVQSWINEAKINIRYFKKSNGGKTSAIFHGFSQQPQGKFTVVLDSDDFLAESFITIVNKETLSLNDNLIGIIGLKSYTNGKVVGDKFTYKHIDYITLYFGKDKIIGDKLFVIRTELYKNSYALPYLGEKFLPDNIPYIKLNNIGKYKLINEIFYYGDYLEDGMTNNVKKMAINNINGYILEKKLLQKEIKYFPNLIINEIKYLYYSFHSGKKNKEIISFSNSTFLSILLFLPALFLFWYLKIFRNN